MLVRVTQDRVQHVGKRGDVRDLPFRQARALILLGKVEDASDAEQPQPVAASPPRKNRRRYKRRDLQAEESDDRADSDG